MSAPTDPTLIRAIAVTTSAQRTDVYQASLHDEFQIAISRLSVQANDLRELIDNASEADGALWFARDDAVQSLYRAIVTLDNVLDRSERDVE